jgi:nucleoside-diphosphate-sugar epimerase
MLLFLISGSSGFIGSNLFNELAVIQKHKVIVVNRQYLYSSYNLKNDFKELDFGQIKRHLLDQTIIFIHCATKFVKFNIVSDRKDLNEANVSFPLKVIVDILNVSSLKVINLNSYWQALDGDIGSSNSIYADSKNEFLTKFNELQSHSNITRKDIYLFDNYGIGDKRDKLFPLLIDRSRFHNTLQLNDVGQVLNFLHINDVISGILKVTFDESTTDVFELSSKSSFSMKQILEIFEGAFNKSMRCEWKSLEPTCYMLKKWQIASIPTGWKESIALDSGISSLVKNLSG